MYPSTLDDAVEAAEVFTAVGEHHIAGRGEEALTLLSSYVDRETEESARCPERQLRQLAFAGCLVTASMVRDRSATAPGLFGALELPAGYLPAIPPADRAAFLAVAATLNGHDAQMIVNSHDEQYGTGGLRGLVAALLASYVRVVKPA